MRGQGERSPEQEHKQASGQTLIGAGDGGARATHAQLDA